jgi:acyl carrier protein
LLTAEDAVEAVNRVMSERRADWEPVTPDTRFDDVGLDSLDLAELFIVLEEMAHTELDPASAENLERVGDLVNMRRL